tara:strand:- start:5 stop:1174 length:1170 start_codon:yes stop_codon:yes gene_type:complete
MKNLLTLSLIGTYLLTGSNPAKADWDYWVVKKDDATRHNLHKFYTYDTKTGTETYRTSFCEEDIQNLPNGTQVETCTVYKISFNEETGQPVVESLKDYSYDLSTDTWTGKTRNSGGSGNTTWKDNYDYEFQMPKILNTSDGVIKIGSTSNTLIKRESNGEIHIGKNSLITPDEHSTLSDGSKVQHLWAEDENDNKIPINIYGSKLLIDGVEVTPIGKIPQVTTNKNNISTNSSNIKNLGDGIAGSTALSAALTALPQTSKESKLSCGVGTGVYSSKYALGFGCASKVNERVDINAGGSYVFGGSKSYGEGTLDNGVIKAGFVFKLGRLKEPIKLSSKSKKNLETTIETLATKNETLQNTVSKLMARLERLEKVALEDLKSKDLAVYKLQ